MEIAGIKEGEVSSFDAKELEKEFNPQEYDRMMKKAFGEEYYEAEDADLAFGSDMDEDGGEIEKLDFDKEDELLGLPKGWDSVGSGDGFLAAREKVLKLKKENVVSEEGKQEKKRKLALLERAKKEMMDEYYKLDYEDTIGDLKTRFKYAKIKRNRYGLSTAEILVMDEKELNQYVSLKKLAPYTEKEWKVPNNKRNEIKQKVKEIFKQGKLGNKKNRKKQKISDAKDLNLSMDAADNHQRGNPSRSARRRRNQAARKLPASRLMAYGMMPVKSKKKGKH
ncbi:protein kri1 [Prunus yedoensis var. nudiflora]|uniref:Protein kri1 n=1 Tax=Prunus yedoensis var. nudiflora TaxID=2094558 RepID=A0A314YRK4_PRUYE|nr:protein kri1 [Prunus yedoensis var. nudiflora]